MNDHENIRELNLVKLEQLLGLQDLVFELFGLFGLDPKQVMLIQLSDELVVEAYQRQHNILLLGQLVL